MPTNEESRSRRASSYTVRITEEYTYTNQLDVCYLSQCFDFDHNVNYVRNPFTRIQAQLKLADFIGSEY